MPWHIAKSEECPSSKPWAVIKDSDGKIVGCHASKSKAQDQLAALEINVEESKMTLWEKIINFFRGNSSQERAIGLSFLREQVFDLLMEREEWAWPIDIYLDESDLYAVVVENGKLYRVDFNYDGADLKLGEWIQVEEYHKPIGRTVIRQTENGRWRWFSISATAALNRVGQIDSRDLFDSFIEQAEETGNYPIRDFYHGGELFRTGQADFMARDNHVFITSGLYDDSELAKMEIEARKNEPEYWGDSIAFLPTEEAQMIEVAEGVSIPVYTRGTIRFISTLPESEAASIYTTGVVREADKMLEGRAYNAFVKLFGGDEDSAKQWLEDNADATNRAIEQENIITREAETEPETDPEPTPEPETELAEREIELDDDAVSALVDAVTSSEVFTNLIGQLGQLEESLGQLTSQIDQAIGVTDEQIGTIRSRLETLEREEEELHREWVNDLPRNRVTRVTYRPREVNRPENPGSESLEDVAQSTLAGMPNY